jgi:uncharacterized membrane protein YeaQ/YmgE (transglycosylase-associated protein family)
MLIASDQAIAGSIVCVTNTSTAPAGATFARSTRSPAISSSAGDEQGDGKNHGQAATTVTVVPSVSAAAGSTSAARVPLRPRSTTMSRDGRVLHGKRYPCAPAQVGERSPWISADAGDTLMSHAAKEHVMGILGWIILGLLAGAIAKALHKGHEPGGVLGTLVVGVAGALAGGLIASTVGIGGIGSFFNLGTWLIAVGGALVLLVIYSTLAGGRRSTRATG